MTPNEADDLVRFIERTLKEDTDPDLTFDRQSVEFLIGQYWKRKAENEKEIERLAEALGIKEAT